MDESSVQVVNGFKCPIVFSLNLGLLVKRTTFHSSDEP
jgi:hypothetical protein